MLHRFGQFLSIQSFERSESRTKCLRQCRVSGRFVIAVAGSRKASGE
jgi:hypothetical protein